MADLSFSFPKIRITFSSLVVSKQWQLAIAGGRAPAKEWLNSFNSDIEIFCADKGVEAALEAGFIPKLLLGDGDSASKLSYERAAALGTEIKSFPREKDDTDLQLLLSKLEKKNLCITGIWGGRFDHLYSNVFSLLNWFKVSSSLVIMADERELMLLLGPQDKVEVEFLVDLRPKALSILTLTDKAVVDLNGVHWPLKAVELNYLRPYAISNEVELDKIQCKCYSGYIGLYMCLKE